MKTIKRNWLTLFLFFVAVGVGFRQPIAEAIGRILRITDQGEVRFYEARTNGNNYIALKGPSSATGDVTLTLPTADGSANQFLKTNGSGALSFSGVSGLAVFNVTDSAYGAIPDDSIADTTAVQAAFTAANAAKGAVYFPPGVYDLGQITVGSSVKLVFGDGWGSELKQVAAGADILYFDDSEGCIVERLKFQGVSGTASASSNSAINFTSSSGGASGIGNAVDLTVRDCWFRQMRNAGVLVEYTQRVTIENNFVDACCFGFLCYYVEDCRVVGNRIGESQVSGAATPELVVGISINQQTPPTPTEHNQRVVVRDNSIEAWKYGQTILLHDAVNAVVSGNSMQDVLHGIHVFPASSVTFQDVKEIVISGNTIRHNLAAQSPVGDETNSYGILVAGNEASDPSSGISIVGNTIYGANHAQGNSNEGAICINSKTDGLVISGNVVTYSGCGGIVLGADCENAAVTGNVIRDVDTKASMAAGILLPSTTIASGLIADNVIDDSQRFGIYAHSSADVDRLIVANTNLITNTTEDSVSGVKPHGPISVKMFGAIGDGTTGGGGTLDTKSVQDAFDLANAIGGSVYFPAGSYRLGEITAGANVGRVFGDGIASVLIQNAWNADILDFDDSNGVVVEKLFFQGQPTTTEISAGSNSGINYSSPTGGTTGIGNAGPIVVRDCVFKQFRFSPVLIEFSDSVVFDGNTIDTCIFGPLFYFNHNVRCTNNYMNESMAAGQVARAEAGYPQLTVGISINQAANPTTKHNSRVVVEGNTFSEFKYGQAILVHDAINCTIANNQLDEVLLAIGVRPATTFTGQRVSDISIIGNTIRHDTDAPDANQETDFGSSIAVGGDAGVSKAERVAIVGNTVYGAGIGNTSEDVGAITLTSECEQITIANNVIEYIGGQGVWLSAGADRVAVTGNVIHNIDARAGRQYGIFLNGSSPIAGLISNNVIDDAGTGVFIASSVDPSDLTVRDNHMQRVTTRINNQSSTDYTHETAFATIYANSTGPQAMTTTPTVITFDNNGQASGATADSGNDRITIGDGGRYLVLASYSGEADVTAIDLIFTVYADAVATVAKAQVQPLGLDSFSASISQVLQLNAGDLIDLRCETATAGTVNLTHEEASLTVVWVGE